MLRKSFNLMVRKGISPFFAGSKAVQISASRSISLKPKFEKLKLTPPPPGGVEGGVNDDLKKPEIDFFHGSYHWDYERITAVALIPLTMIPMYGAIASNAMYPMIDTALCCTLLIHAQLGFTSCIIDYIPKRKFGIWHRLAMLTLYSGTAFGLYGVYELETNNNGLVDLICKLWKNEEADLPIFSRY
ncbi:LAME_0H18580g1_1 [Lachancea meyersii CBS 8951]|uniref:Succinate dehydrogenase [ubiquinone] cytochrome b small subunit n=1 Tax=Lachancea meyersii CBS 8951 TaxID=1266667 RepID=A0A1G4KIS5_9SACH|nr:LAME_0H18580g1_1 [Lachancea meyersii CBS 8951]